MVTFYLVGFATCWFGLGIIGAGFYGGDSQQVDDEIDFYDFLVMIAAFAFTPFGLLGAWISTENREMTWITIPKYKSKGQKFLEKLES